MANGLNHRDQVPLRRQRQFRALTAAAPGAASNVNHPNVARR